MQDPAEGGDMFGWSLAAGDFNGDKFDDLAIGVPGETIGEIYRAGALNVVHGSATGLSTAAGAQFWHQDVPGVGGIAGFKEYFGYALAVGDFDDDGRKDLAVGVPLDSDWGVGEREAAGVVNVIYGPANALSASELWHQDVVNVEDLAERWDFFGWSLAAGDFNGDRWDDLAIGVPGENVGSVPGAGAVNVIYGSSSGLHQLVIPNQFWHQDVANVEDAAGAEDSLGGDELSYDLDPFTPDRNPFTFVLYDNSSSMLASGDFNGDKFEDLAIGVPGEDLESASGTLEDAGAVNLIYGSPGTGLSVTTIPDQFWTQFLSRRPFP